MLASDIWYKSITFWTVSGVAVAFITLVMSVAVWWLGSRRRLLTYTVAATIPLLNREAPDFPGSDVQVIVRGHTLRSPYVTSVHIENHSRKDISSTDFDQGKPLAVDVGVLIAELLDREDLNKNSPHIKPGIDGSKVTIEPTLIRGRQVIKFDLLTDGRPSVTCDGYPLVNVRVRRQLPPPVLPMWVNWLGGICLLLFIVGIVLGLLGKHHAAVYNAGAILIGFSVLLVLPVAVSMLVETIRYLKKARM